MVALFAINMVVCLGLLVSTHTRRRQCYPAGVALTVYFSMGLFGASLYGQQTGEPLDLLEQVRLPAHSSAAPCTCPAKHVPHELCTSVHGSLL